MMAARRLIVSGRVQGVCYRNWTIAEARALGLKGWVRNLRSGEVEILAQGPDEAIEALIEKCRSGPPAAIVVGVRAEPVAAAPMADFSQRPTA